MFAGRVLAALLCGSLFAADVVAQGIAKVDNRPAPTIEALASPVTVRLRGLSAVDENIAWASGREGTVLRTTDAGKTWSVFKVPGAEKLDFRDVEGFSADEALVLSIGPGEDSRVYRTADAGRTWVLVLANHDKDGFFDCMDFDGDEGRLLGDPVHGRFQVYATSDGGRSWRWTKGPRALKDEAAFAASGTCVRRVREGTVVVTGGAKARVHFLPDQFAKSGDWRALEASLSPAAPSSGLFSIALRRGTELIAVGGDYKNESGPGLVLGTSAKAHIVPFGVVTSDGPPYLENEGNDLSLRRVPIPYRWQRADFRPFRMFEGAPTGYRSAVACASDIGHACIATGPMGIDLLPPVVRSSERQRKTAVAYDVYYPPVDDFEIASRWQRISDTGYDSVDVAGRVFWFSGDNGRLGRLVLPEEAKPR